MLDRVPNTEIRRYGRGAGVGNRTDWGVGLRQLEHIETIGEEILVSKDFDSDMKEKSRGKQKKFAGKMGLKKCLQEKN